MCIMLDEQPKRVYGAEKETLAPGSIVPDVAPVPNVDQQLAAIDNQLSVKIERTRSKIRAFLGMALGVGVGFVGGRLTAPDSAQPQAPDLVSNNQNISIVASASSGNVHAIKVDGGIDANIDAKGDANVDAALDAKVKMPPLPEMQSDQDFYDRLVKLGSLLSPEDFPNDKHMSVLYLEPTKNEIDINTKYMKYTWEIAGTSLHLQDNTVIAVKVSKPEMRGKLDFPGVKYRWRTDKDGIDYFYYACAQKSQASIVLKDPNPIKKPKASKNSKANKDTYLKVVEVNLIPCQTE